MSAKIIDGKALANEVKQQVKGEVEKLAAAGIVPGLAVVLVGDDPASQIYVRNKEKSCQELGIKSEVYRLPATTTQEELETLIDRLNADPHVHGILVQLPLPAPLREKEITDRIKPEKDVDGFHPVNLGRLLRGEPGIRPCTPAGIMELIKASRVEVKGRECVVVGRSNIVGKPVFHLLLQEHGTVTVCHSRTPDLVTVTRRADILVVAVGKAGLIDGTMVKPGAVVIDVGVNRLPSGKVVGDVDFSSAQEVAGAITPVPGGVGPMTIAMLMKNTVEAVLLQYGEKLAKD
ncbi:MAG TPA: bifunctional methylenetetrahydrofolate dehydrogenase/methenyltetrahydrofolate cyclohydrolase FolD [Firmicutes bacterium]|uniref:Bifunctional protein FolD n=1 Tax=Capillibacterium thermochitinicola TaxID=2699427 RepID=A0A8J6I141_9FIRM|nr:bifunctional methylenetetrahydrofolate dehydrogenase/methenyltetrahydrofolate cyclohydrolase FolD [Capillibacterium thermochitinicola]MBA2132759.1 bifunctional methylenetetrahydrofolate dehydrogenase/methenyltetrahydrofolate cyclohydrolase FolD [Capillibacterium thermochitinicola]HHW12506.1 bifunctional methylenetetrahydrofolate dehydrogenase/methenyltetrahydrofolate cyclohydrolase FolD [Bacillota bacterium]